jgi:hypothetical protein
MNTWRDRISALIPALLLLNASGRPFQEATLRRPSDAPRLGTDLERARRVALQIRAGRLVINNMTDDPQAPRADSNTPPSAANMAGAGWKRFSKLAQFLSPREDIS